MEVKPLPVYAPHLEELGKAKTTDAETEFKYEDADQNKKARSYVFALRKLRSAVDKTRKDAKAEALEFGRQVDSQAKEIAEGFTKIIDRHANEIQAIEDREANRIAVHQEALEKLTDLATLSNEYTKGQYVDRLERLLEWEIDETWEEFMAQASHIRTKGIEVLTDEIARMRKIEADAAELEELRKAQAAKDQEEREEAIRKQAAADAEAKRKADLEEAERDAQRREEAAAQEVRDAHAREEQRKAEERAEQQRLEEWEAEQEAARQADVEHQGAIESKALEQLAVAIFRATGVENDDNDTALFVLEAICKGKIPHVSITY